MADPLANAFKSPPKNALEHAVGALPATLVGLAPAAATLFALLSDGRPLSIAGGAATVLGAFLSVTSARGGRRVASETVRLQEGLTDLESKGVLRSDLHQEWFRQLVRDFLKESAREEDELHREQLRHVVLRGSMKESPNGRASIYFEIARRLSGQDIDLLKSLRDTGEAYETAYDSHPDVGVLRRELLAKLEARYSGFDESWVLLVREGLKEGPPGTAVTAAGRDNHPFRLTYAGLQLLEWVSWPPAITV